MPIVKELVLEKGWKESENNRFGYCLVIRHINQETKEIIFREALYLVDKDFYVQAFNSLFTLDDLHKEYIDKIKQMGIKFSSDVKEECNFISAKRLEHK
jgi:hypothetical protein